MQRNIWCIVVAVIQEVKLMQILQFDIGSAVIKLKGGCWALAEVQYALY